MQGFANSARELLENSPALKVLALAQSIYKAWLRGLFTWKTT